MQVLNGRGISYIDVSNYQTFFNIRACLVQREIFGFHELRTSVCGSGNSSCRSVTHQDTCPTGVLYCICNDGILPVLHVLLEQAETKGNNVQLEVLLDLSLAPGFLPTSPDQIAAEYVRVTDALFDNLTHGIEFWKDLSLLQDTILLTDSGMPLDVAVTSMPQSTIASVNETATPRVNSASEVDWKTSFLLGILCILFLQRMENVNN